MNLICNSDILIVKDYIYGEQLWNIKKLTSNTARRIRVLRQLKGWSQKNLAHSPGLSVVYIGQLERQEKVPTIETIGKLCNALDSVVSVMKTMPADTAARVARIVSEIDK